MNFSADLAISGIIPRSDDQSVAVKVPGVNKLLKTFCNQNGWGFVDHSNISSEHDLNSSGLHLNTKGTARLATNFINYLRDDYDDRLSWSNYIKELCRKISSAIGALRRIRSLVSQSTAVQIYNALIQPPFDYCAPVWDGLSSHLCEKLQKLQNRAARFIDHFLNERKSGYELRPQSFLGSFGGTEQR